MEERVLRSKITCCCGLFPLARSLARSIRPQKAHSVRREQEWPILESKDSAEVNELACSLNWPFLSAFRARAACRARRLDPRPADELGGAAAARSPGGRRRSQQAGLARCVVRQTFFGFPSALAAPPRGGSQAAELTPVNPGPVNLALSAFTQA